MKKIGLLAMAMACSILVSCSKDDANSAKDKDGLCTQATIDAYNNINYTAKQAMRSGSRADLVAAQNSCNGYKALLGGNSCRADIKKEGDYFGTETVVTSSSRDDVCNKISNALLALDYPQQRVNQPGSSSRPQPTQPGQVNPLPRTRPAGVVSADDLKKIVGLKESIEITIGSATVTSLEDGFFNYQEGQRFDFNSLVLDSSKPYCSIISTNTALKTIGAKATLNLIEPSQDGKSLTISASEETSVTQISCSPGSKKIEDLTIGDLNMIFGSLIKFEIGR